MYSEPQVSKLDYRPGRNRCSAVPALEPEAADGILDQLIHNAHRHGMREESMCKKRSTKPTD